MLVISGPTWPTLQGGIMKTLAAYLDARAWSWNLMRAHRGERFPILRLLNPGRIFTGSLLLAGGWAESSFLPKTDRSHPDGSGAAQKLHPCRKGA